MNNSEFFPFIEETVDKKVDEIFTIAHTALASAIMTGRNRIPAQRMRELALIAGKYLEHD